MARTAPTGGFQPRVMALSWKPGGVKALQPLCPFHFSMFFLHTLDGYVGAPEATCDLCSTSSSIFYCIFFQRTGVPPTSLAQHIPPSDSLTWLKPVRALTRVGAALVSPLRVKTTKPPSFFSAALTRTELRPGYKRWFPLTVVLRGGQDPALRFNDRRAALKLHNLSNQ